MPAHADSTAGSAVSGRPLLDERDSRRTQREDEEQRQDRHGAPTSPAVAQDARAEEVPRPGAQYDPIGDDRTVWARSPAGRPTLGGRPFVHRRCERASAASLHKLCACRAHRGGELPPFP